MKPSTDEQQKLLALVYAQFKNKAAAAAYLQEVFGTTSRSSLHDRLTGKTPIYLDQALRLMRERDISMHMLASNGEGTISCHAIVPSSVDTTLDDYLNWLERDIKDLSSAPVGHIWHKTDDMPIFWLKHNRLLAAFKIYFWHRALRLHKGEGMPPFNAAWWQSPDIAARLDQSRRILHQYQAIPSVEIWGEGMFDSIIRQVADIKAVGGFDDPAMQDRLYGAIGEVIDCFATAARTGYKNPAQRSGPLQAFENNFLSSGNMLLGKGTDVHFMYVDIGYPDFIRHNKPELVVNRQQRLEMMRRHLIPITESERNHYDFFHRLRKSLPA
jgi:hypothetical protein